VGVRFPRETLRLAFKLVRRTPGRSSLTVLGLAIGVGAFIAMVSFGEGARRSVIAQFELLGTNLVKIQSTPVAGARQRPPAALTRADAELLARDGTTLTRVEPIARRRASVAHGGEQRITNVYGAGPDFLVMHAWSVGRGGLLDAIDQRERAKTCLLGATPARALFGDRDPIGETLSVAETLPCRIVGLLAEKGFSTAGDDLDDIVIVPTTTFDAHLGDREGYAYIEVEPADPRLLASAIEEVSAILRRSHGLLPGEPNDFKVSSPLEVIRAVETTSRILSALLASIAAVSLLVGGIGIMNIQLVSVAERTAEIGIRAAVGASPRQILAQFLVEASILTLFGTLVGVGLGIAAASIVAELMAWPRVISPTGVALSASFGAFVGIAFGYLPARRAARLDPIHALRRD
jgi:putative ABC transport system permease protein